MAARNKGATVLQLERRRMPSKPAAAALPRRRVYVADPDQAEAWQRLVGRPTVTDNDIEALEALGVVAVIAEVD